MMRMLRNSLWTCCMIICCIVTFFISIVIYSGTTIMEKMVIPNTLSVKPNLRIVNTTDLGTITYVQRLVNTNVVYDNITWDTPSTFNITCISNATILYTDGLVFNYQFKPFSFGMWYWQKDESKIYRVRDVHVYPTHTFSFVQIWTKSFQHITFDTLPKVVLACKWLQQRPWIMIIIVNNLQGDLIREFCTLDKKRFHVLDRTSSFLSVCVSNFGNAFRHGVVPPGSMTSLGSQTNAGTDVIYIARTRGHKRSVVNEKEVLSTIREILSNVTVVYPTGNWKENRKSFENARVIIGPHGGAFGNMIFAPIGTNIIEFTPLKSYKLREITERPCYFGLAHALGFKYYSVEPKIFDFDKPMTMDINRLKHILQEVIEL